MMAFVVAFLATGLVLVSLLAGAWRFMRRRAAHRPNEETMSDDAMRAAAALAVLRTGRPHLATRDESGVVTIRPLGDDK